MSRKVNVPLERAMQVGPPTTVVLATCLSAEGKPNIISLGMYMPISRDPPMVVIGVSPKRYSHGLIKETKEFVVNVPSKSLVNQVILCGTLSGRERDKFKEAGLTPIPASKVKPPLIKECVSNLECRVVADHTCGDRTLFVGEVVAAHIDDRVLKNERLDVSRAQPISHKGESYFTLEAIR